MLKIISSKNESLVYTEVGKLKKKFGFFVATQSVSLQEAMARVADISIFGDKEVFLVNIKNGDLEMLEQEINSGEDGLQVFEQSENLFIFVGSGVEFEKFFGRGGVPYQVIKLEEKKVFDFPADLVTALQKGDKKNAWNLLLKELNNKDAEPVHGTCIFAYKSLLVYLNDPKKNGKDSGVKEFSWNNAKRNAIAGKRERGEVVDKYFDLIYNYHKARLGDVNLDKGLEHWILKN